MSPADKATTQLFPFKNNNKITHSPLLVATHNSLSPNHLLLPHLKLKGPIMQPTLGQNHHHLTIEAQAIPFLLRPKKALLFKIPPPRRLSLVLYTTIPWNSMNLALEKGRHQRVEEIMIVRREHPRQVAVPPYGRQ